MSTLTRRTLPTVLAALSARAIVSDTEPLNPNIGAIWFDSVEGALKVWDGTTWNVAQIDTTGLADGSVTDGKIQDGTISEAKLGFALPDGTKVTVDSVAPSAPAVNDLWIDTSSGSVLKQWDGTTWTAYQFGSGALAANSVTASQIAANAVTAAKLAAGIVYAGIVDATTIEGAQFIAHGTSGEILVYDGTPAAGNLVMAVSGAAGTDTFGNPFTKGLSLSAVAFGSGTGYLTWVNEANTADTTFPPQIFAQLDGSTPPKLRDLFIEGPAVSGSGDVAVIQLNSTGRVTIQDSTGNAVDIAPGTGLTFDSPDGFSFNGHNPGLYYSVDATFAESCASGTTTTVSAITKTHEDSDYGNPWIGGTFTAPVSGYYDVTAHCASVTSQTELRAAIRVNGNVRAQGMVSVSGTDTSTCVTGVFLAAGDTVDFRIRQVSGATRTVSGNVTISRRI